MTYLFGYPAALVLRDEDGEFEVRNAFTVVKAGEAKLDLHRITDAITTRNAQKSPAPKRPIY